MDIPLPPPTIIDRDVRDRNTIDLPSWNAFDGCRYRSGQQQFGKREVEKKKKGRKSTVEQLWTRLFIPINSLPSRIPLHVRYFPRNLHRGRSIFEAAANRGPVSASDPSKSRRTRRTSAGNRWRIGRGVVKTRRRTESGGERRDGEEGQSPRQAENLAAPSRDDAAPQ